jgi:hypothetical protein
MWRDLPIMLAAPAQTVFVLLYTLRPLGAGEWWCDFVGRALAFKSTALMLLIDAATLGYVAHWARGADLTWAADEHGIDQVVMTLYWVVAAAIYYQLAALIHERSRNR